MKIYKQKKKEKAKHPTSVGDIETKSTIDAIRLARETIEEHI
jgi:hypothetical protein